jgi:GNAT superfamily N-acetyltransferase
MLHLYRRGWFGWCVKAGEAILILKAEQLFELSEISLEPRFRGSGAGSALLSEAVCFARAHGAHRIAGHITAEDYAATPYLFQFYERCGFRVGPPQAAKRLAAIELVL